MFVQSALGLGLIHHAHQFLLGDGVVIGAVEQQGDQFLPLGEQEIQGGEHHQKELQQGKRGHSPRLGRLLGQALGGDFAEDQDDHREHCGGDGRAALGTGQLDEQHGADGGGCVVDDVVSDQDGR